MSELPQIAHRWEPILGIPETPAYDFAVESSGAGRLALTLKYSLIAGNDARDMRLVFGEVLAFRTHWDGDKPVVGGIADPPKCCEGPCEGFAWPLLTIENSDWLASGDFAVSRHLASDLGQEQWSQFSVITLERGVDIIARGLISTAWLPTHAD
jgi:hypothetical protein